MTLFFFLNTRSWPCHCSRPCSPRSEFWCFKLQTPFLTTSINDIFHFDCFDVQGLDHVIALEHVDLGLHHDVSNFRDHLWQLLLMTFFTSTTLMFKVLTMSLLLTILTSVWIMTFQTSETILDNFYLWNFSLRPLWCSRSWPCHCSWPCWPWSESWRFKLHRPFLTTSINNKLPSKDRQG